MPLAELLVEESWLKALPGELDKPYAKTLACFLEREIIVAEGKGSPIYPPQQLVFNALNTTPFDRVKAVIIGQVTSFFRRTMVSLKSLMDSCCVLLFGSRILTMDLVKLWVCLSLCLKERSFLLVF